MRLLFWAGAQRLLPLLLLLAVLQVSANPQPKERHYYIAAVEIDWNYSGDVSDRFNTTYKKVVFREYEKGFQQAKTHPSWLGLLGPTLRAEQGETIVVTFRNMASRPHSIHPHGVAYGKQSEGAPYFDNTSLKEKEDDLVQPGCEHVYYWEVTPEVSPQPHDPTCLTHMYISHRNVVEEYNAGLIGALLVCKHSSLDARGQQKSVAQEMVFLFGIFDEKVSEMEPKGLSLDNHVKYTINGYAKGTLPGIVLCAHSFISLHLMGMSSEPELFSVHLNGQVLQQTGSKVSSVGLISGSTATASVVPAHTGRWLMSSFIAKHIEVGMHAFVDVKKCDQYESPRRQLTVAQKRESKEWKYYIAAEEIFWDYAPDLPKHVDSSFEADFLTKSATRIGQKYKKVVYTLYSNASFTKPLESRQRRSELGILGPVIRAQIRDVVRIVFKNKASRPYSIYPHGLTIEKSEEGANYPAGGNQTHGVQPGETHTYLWRVIEEDEPLDGDSRCLTRMYHSAVDAPRDIASGLIGPILICKSQSLNIKNAQVRADKEQHAVFAVFDENKSWYLDDNIKLFSDPSRVSKEDSAFQKSNVMHTINGYMYEGGPTVGFCNGEVATWHVSSVGAQDYIQTVTFYGHPFEVNGRTEDFLSLYPMTGETIAMNMDNTGFWLLVSLNSHESTKGMRVKFQDVECYRESLYEYEERDFEVWTLPTSEDTEIKEEINVPKNPGKTETDMYTDMWADQLGIRSHKNQSRGASAEKIDLSFLDYDFKDVVSGATENNSQNTGDLQLQIVSSPRNNSSIGTRNDKSNVEVEPRALPTGASLPNHGSSNHTEFIDLSTLKQDGKNLTLRGQEKTNDTTVTQGATNLTLTLEDHSNVTLSTQQPVAQNYLTQESNNHTQDLRNLSLSTQHPTIPTQEPTNHTFSIQEQTNSTQDFTSLNLSAQNPTNTTQHPTNLTLSTKTPTYLNITAQKVTNITLQEEETEKLSLINLNDTLIGTANSTSNESSISNVTMPKIINTLALHNTTYLSSRDEVILLLAKHNNVSIKTENGNLTKLENASVHITKPETDVVLAIPKNISLKNMEYNTSNMTSEPHLTNPAANILNISSILEMKGKHTLEQPEEKHTRGDVFLYTEPSKNLDTAVVHDTSDTLGVRHANDTSVLNNTITNQTSVNGSDFTHISLLDGIQSNDTLDEESNSLEDLPFFIDEPSPRNVSTNEVERGLSEEDSYSESKEEVIIYLKENQTEVIKSSSVNAKDHSWTYTGSHQTEVMEIPEDMVKYIGDKIFGEPKKKRKLKKINLRQRPEKGFGMKTKRRKEYKPQVKSGLPISPRGFNPIVNPRGSRPLLQQPVLDEEELLNTPVVIGVPRPDFSDYELYIPGEEPSHLEIDLTNTNANDYEFVSYKDPYSSQEDIQDLSLGEANEVSGLYDKIYYISAEEVDWDYAGFGQQRQEKSQPLNSRETKFTKVVFRGYLDSKFKIPDIRGEMDEHLGILGPPIKAEVGQTIMVVFRNNARRPFSIHPNGVSYTKRTEGLSYEDGSNYLFQYDNEVKPNTTFGYVWKVSSKAGPSSEESKCRTWAYYSGVNPEKDIHSGLIGPLLVCRKGTLDKQVIDMREFTLLFMTFDESQSWYYDVNYQRTWRKSRRKMRDFHGENLKFRSINGITHNLKGLRMYTDQLVCWHLINMGSPKDFQSVHFHGQTFIHRKTNGYRQAVYPLLPGNFATLEMFPSKPGLWLLESEVGFNQQKGMQTLFLVLDNACYRTLGLERRIVNDDKITAINTRDYWEPHLARLNNGGKYNAWSTEHNDSWIQVDFERPVVISQVAIQGAKQLFQSQFVVKFFISYSNDRRKWYYYKGDGHHLQKMFMGNQEAYVTKTNTFFPPLIGRFVRLHPVEWYNKATVRMEYYGCELDGCSVPLGMESRRIEDHRITASSTASSWTWEWKPSLARLNKKGTINAWQARFNDQNQWLQVELPEKKKITGIITQGAKTLMKEMYVISYTLQYSDDGLHWIHYTDDDGNLPKVFLGNTDNNKHAKNYIYPPIFSRFVRINPSSWMGAITMRIELLGCDFD